VEETDIGLEALAYARTGWAKIILKVV